MGRVAFGALSGLGVGAVIEIIARLTGSVVAPFPVWVPLGALLGALANLRWLDKRSVTQRIRNLSAEYGLDVDPTAIVGDLPVGAQQRVEIMKALYREAGVLILDEPTAVLTPQEADDLFVIMRQLIDRGVSIIFITHKLREVLAVADRITVLRRGEVVGTTTPDEASLESLARMMVGREVLLQVRKGPAKPGDAVLQVNELILEDDRHHQIVSGVSFTVRSGEIVGIAGVQGNGQTQLVEAITRLRQVKSGDIQVLAHNVTHQTTRLVTSLGVWTYSRRSPAPWAGDELSRSR